jgi:hypothetical protein
MEKFSDQVEDIGANTIDLTAEVNDLETNKRDFSFLASTSDADNKEPVMKQVKIEKD